MDPIRNPYAPGAGTPPPELAGRDEIRETARIALERARIGRSSKSIIMVGLRGVGKTVLLDRIKQDAATDSILAVSIEAPEDRSIPDMLAPHLRNALLRLSTRENARQQAQRALRALTGFVRAFRVNYQGVELSLDFEPEPGLADNGDLEVDLPDLLETVGYAAKSAEACVALYIDELQYVRDNELAALITALHRTSQRQLPVIMLGAGLPQVRSNLGEAKSYAERLFLFPEIGPLSQSDARKVIAKPAQIEGVEITSDTLDAIIRITRCYPYFLQEWGFHLWNVADSSPISIACLDAASQRAISELDSGFFRVRFDRLTPQERNYVRAMADLGEGPYRSSTVAEKLNRNVQFFSPTRDNLISKGTIWSTTHGYIDFTVPMFDEFLRRVMPGDDWRSAQ
ncbi:MAG: ATP-binding protein [Chloroflexota bacterium]|nr:ATP-binding protein [Chloroflexota bacterium]MDE2958478.1 ATP-binding protein [Chloroflexota bacterium]